MLDADTLRAFDETGIAHLHGAIAARDVDGMRSALWAELARRHGIREHEPASWHDARPSSFRALAKRGAFAAMASPAVRGALDALFAPAGWAVPPHWGQPLLRFPERVAWDVPRAMWHLDFCGTPSAPLASVRVFAFLGSVKPRGGGTLAVAGSYRLVEALARRAGAALRSADVRERLAALDPWLAALEERGGANRVQRFLRDGAVVAGVPLRVVEICGEPGDVAVMRADTLHTIAPNTLDSPRLVVAEFVMRAGAGAALSTRAAEAVT